MSWSLGHIALRSYTSVSRNMIYKVTVIVNSLSLWERVGVRGGARAKKKDLAFE